MRVKRLLLLSQHASRVTSLLTQQKRHDASHANIPQTKMMGGTQIACQIIALVVLSDAVLVPLHRTACSMPDSKQAQKMVSNSAVQSVCQEDQIIGRAQRKALRVGSCRSASTGCGRRWAPAMVRSRDFTAGSVPRGGWCDAKASTRSQERTRRPRKSERRAARTPRAHTPHT